MAYRPILAIVLRYVYLLRSTPARWMPVFTWVAIDMVLWGYITKYLNTIITSGMNFVPTLLGAVLFFDFFSRVIFGVSGVFLEDVWSRNFLNLFASPLSVSQYLAGLVTASLATSLLGLALMIAIATAVFGLPFLSYGAMVVPFLLILFLFGISLGIIASAVVLRLGPSAEWFIWPVPAVISPLAGVFYPLANLPVWLQYLGKLLPASYVFEGLRAVVAGHGVPLSGLLAGGGLAVIYLLLACWFFKRTFAHAVRTGILARYSAENLG